MWAIMILFIWLKTGCKYSEFLSDVTGCEEWTEMFGNSINSGIKILDDLASTALTDAER